MYLNFIWQSLRWQRGGFLIRVSLIREQTLDASLSDAQRCVIAKHTIAIIAMGNLPWKVNAAATATANVNANNLTVFIRPPTKVKALMSITRDDYSNIRRWANRRIHRKFLGYADREDTREKTRRVRLFFLYASSSRGLADFIPPKAERLTTIRRDDRRRRTFAIFINSAEARLANVTQIIKRKPFGRSSKHPPVQSNKCEINCTRCERIQYSAGNDAHDYYSHILLLFRLTFPRRGKRQYQ